ncbi:MAG: hypothetical protein ACI4MU_07800, partial [Candidatus Ventricola sp.]
MIDGVMCSNQTGFQSTHRQVTLRSLTAFSLIASRLGTLGDFIPQTPSLGTRPQTPSSLRAVSNSFAKNRLQLPLEHRRDVGLAART